ncbi:MAG: DUF1549 domain-containing protein [Planctomycetaceae bacterium]|nr:DUF1549 domain-containing protein [Planctomycetaceae bacterium]
MNSRAALLKGGDYGPAIVPGKPGQSLLIQVIQQTHKELRMPPEKGDKLSAKTIANFRHWIEQGAPWPKGNTAHSTNAIRSAAAKSTSSHWFFQPRQTIQVPIVENQQWAESPIDQFVYTKLQEQKLEPVELASRRVLIRRATFDLTGLPPTQQEVEQFVNDPLSESPAFAKVVDRLLASPAYGQHWGRHWLDVARYADTQGDTGNFPIPGAYLYRNWVIDALNADMPYDKFL